MIGVRRTSAFDKWLRKLRDRRGRQIILGRLLRIAEGNLGDVKRFDGLLEVRIAYGPGYRLYCAERGGDLIVLLCGGDKGSQDRDIERAKQMLGEL